MMKDLIEAYIIEVGRQLPSQGREDVQKEIRSLLEDALEDRSRESGQAVDDAMKVAVLKEFGAPDQVAANYGAVNYLVGPKLYPAFLQVAKIVLPIIAVLALIGMGIRLGQLGQPGYAAGGLVKMLEIGWEAILGLGTSVIQVFGTLALIFAILERTLPRVEQKDEKTWDPHTLEKVEGPDQVGFGEPVFEIVIGLLLLAFLNLYARYLGAGYNAEGGWVLGFADQNGWVMLPALTEQFFRFVPLMNVAILAEIGLNLVLLRKRAWTLATRWLNIGIHVLWIGVMVAMLVGPSLLALDAQMLIDSGGFTAETVEVVMNLLSQMLRWVLIVVIILSGVEIAKTVWRLLRK